MWSVREFIVNVPFLCRAKNAHRISDIFAFVYDKELEKGSAFDRTTADKDDFKNRSKYLWDMLYGDTEANLDIVVYCRTLIEIIERTHYLDEHGEDYHAAIIDELYKELKTVEAEYPDITELMSVDDALTARWS